jgi:general stress protein 26
MKTTTASADPKAYQKLQELVREIDVAMVTTVTPDGALRSRPMATAAFDDDGTIWFFTADDSGKAHDLEEEHAVNLSYAEPRKHRFVSVTGSASLVRDRDKAKELWKASFKSYFPRGLDDAHVTLLAVKIESAEYWDVPSSKMVQLLSITKAAPTGDDPDLGEHTKVEVRATPASG